MSSIDFDRLQSIREYLGFDEHDARLIREFRSVAEADFPAIVDDFYAAIEQNSAARQIITGGREQIERLKSTLTAWLGSLLGGVYAQEYLRQHARIGKVHVRIGLPQYLMFTAMSRVRLQLGGTVERAYADDRERRMQMLRALHRLLDMELCVMLDSYREDLLDRQRARERLATIGELAASVAHELRNPLGTMESSLFLLKRRLEKLDVRDEQVLKHHEKASRQVAHCNDTIGRLLDLASDRPPRFEMLPLLELLQRTLQELELDEAIRVSLTVSDELRVWADPKQLGLVIMNLLRNAYEAAPGGVRVTIAATEQRGGVEVMVADDGPGILPAARPRVFEALFTTRSQGTGLGLALVARIVEAHAGEISLLTPAVGTAFRIWLPGTPPASAKPSAPRVELHEGES